MEGKRVSYQDYELTVKSRSSSGMFFTEQNPITKFGIVVGLFEKDKVCVKCDEDKMLRLFDIEMLEVVDEEYEKVKPHFMKKFQTILNKTFEHKKYGKYKVLRKSKNKTIHNTDLYVIRFLNTGNEKEFIKTKILNRSVYDKIIKTKDKII